jgi:hypothetical protein
MTLPLIQKGIDVSLEEHVRLMSDEDYVFSDMSTGTQWIRVLAKNKRLWENRLKPNLHGT